MTLQVTTILCTFLDNGKLRVMNDKASAIPISLLNEPFCVCVCVDNNTANIKLICHEMY